MKLDKIIAVRTDKTVYKDGDKVVKIFNNNYAKSDILNEALNQARIEETDLNVPRLCEVTKIDGKWAIITSYIPGKTLDMLMKENPQNQDSYINLFVDIQKEILSKSVPLLCKLKEKMHIKISETNLDKSTKDKLCDSLDSMPEKNNVCHGDFNPHNVIITESGEPFVIDWAHVTQGFAAADAARSYLLLAKKPENAEKYLDLFCKKTNTEKECIKKYIPAVAASQLTKGNEHERKFLMNWINNK